MLPQHLVTYYRRLFIAGIAAHGVAMLWMPFFFAGVGLGFARACDVSIFLLIYSLCGQLQWHFRIARPEKKVPALMWNCWIMPSFIVQIWVVLMVPIAAIIWLVIFLNGVPSYFNETTMSTYWIMMSTIGLSMSLYGVLFRNRLCFRHLSLSLNHLPRSFSGYKLVHLSDTHFSNFTPTSSFKKAIVNINAWKPDLIVITGDLLSFGDAFLAESLQLLKTLQAIDGVMFCTGNHDYFVSTEQLTQGLSAIGIRVMDNHQYHLQRSNERLTFIGIPGVVDDLKRQERLLMHVLDGDSGEKNCLILLAHDPNVFVLSSKMNIALTLSGHTHAGQCALPFSAGYNLASKRYPYSAGLYEKDQSTLYVHRGIGTTIIPMRLGSVAEIVFFTLR